MVRSKRKKIRLSDPGEGNTQLSHKWKKGWVITSEQQAAAAHKKEDKKQFIWRALKAYVRLFVYTQNFEQSN